MLMFAGQTPEQLLTGSMPGTENKHYSCAQSAADLYKELFSSLNSQRKRAFFPPRSFLMEINKHQSFLHLPACIWTLKYLR